MYVGHWTLLHINLAPTICRNTYSSDPVELLLFRNIMNDNNYHRTKTLQTHLNTYSNKLSLCPCRSDEFGPFVGELYWDLNFGSARLLLFKIGLQNSRSKVWTNICNTPANRRNNTTCNTPKDYLFFIILRKSWNYCASEIIGDKEWLWGS